MNITPRPYARYRDARGARFDMRHYDEDAPEFADADGAVWRRVAVTTGQYTSARAADAELDRLEAAL